MLYPREREVREVKELGGVWEFCVDKNDAEGFVNTLCIDEFFQRSMAEKRQVFMLRELVLIKKL